MKAFYILVNKIMPVIVIPDADAHVDGHPVLTYSYTLYKSDQGMEVIFTLDTDALIAPAKRKHPDYLGTIYYEELKSEYTYSADGLNELGHHEVAEIIKLIVYYRNNPAIWRI